ncbi:HAMP domain-containing histidine kinase [Mucilaginibacter sp. Bleaf8]|uniref:sensor histidine kinase n=1 Tax=Mucilaginibacter sp. Bleaf8 TaxID=2834430 RepID=UPI001BCC270E|nr:HAMP domain-containing sensor histidine kinase [Mucilaginibacter sp. Bleaf8]MBS7563366.1 HAMP domain-containing histidine kinase [Mucilaginibacter sp. Bleaf8]
MRFKQYEWWLTIKVLLLSALLAAAAYFFIKAQYAFDIALLPFIIYLIANLIQYLKKIQKEVAEFAEAVKYRDFSRHYAIKTAPASVQQLRAGFNEINETYQTIRRERETQYHYLQNILELVGTGILSYEQNGGDTGWINDACKQLLGIPYLRSIHALELRDAALYHEIINLKVGDSKVVSINRDQQVIKVLLTASIIRNEGKIYKLVAFQNVSNAMDESESNAWQKLLNVMTHEIMNSVAPISSLADTLKNRLQQPQIANSAVSAELEDLELGIDTIKRRSDGLLKFTQSYRSLNKITKLELEKILVYDLFENLNTLMLPTLEKKNIELDIVLKDFNLAIEADINLLEQVMINLLVNAIEAVKDQDEPQITLSAEVLPSHKAVLKIADNGIGMPPELLDKIFIPFFSTRKTGSGIGLSLCKQIMLMHKGNIQVHSVEGKGTVFTLQFN